MSSEGALSLLHTGLSTLRKLYLAGVAQEEIKLILTRHEYRQAYFHHRLEMYFKCVIPRSYQVDWAEAYFLAEKKLLHCPGGAYLELALKVDAVDWSLELAGLHDLPLERLEKMFDLTKVDVGEELLKAVSNNSPKVVELLLAFDAASDSRPIEEEKFDAALKLAAYDGHLEILKLFAGCHRFNSDEATKALNAVCLKNQPEVVAFLLTYPGVRVQYGTFELHCIMGNIEIVRLLLPHVDPSRYESMALKQACESHRPNSEGRAKVVKLLLEDGRCDPSCEDNCALRWACQEGYVEIVSLLLKDSRVVPTRGMYQDLLWQESPRQGEIVRLLLQDTRFDPTRFDPEYLQHDGVALVEIMLDYYARLHANDVNHNPSKNNNELLRWSLKQGDVAGVKLLLEVPVVRGALTLPQQMQCYRLLHK